MILLQERAFLYFQRNSVGPKGITCAKGGCGSGEFNSYTTYIDHFVNCHEPGLQFYICTHEACDSKFKTSDDCKNHIKAHHFNDFRPIEKSLRNNLYTAPIEKAPCQLFQAPLFFMQMCHNRIFPIV